MATHRPVFPPSAPTPAGPYVPGMVFERLVFVSGQGARTSQTNELAGADIQTQTEPCLRNVEAVLQAAGSSLQHVLRCGVYLADIRDFQAMNEVYARVFGDHRPARTTIQAVLPLPGMRVEMDCVGYVPDKS